jgi:prephenate dehydrogenase
MTVGILGLGLIGGSLARAYHDAGHRVLGCDRDASTVQFAQMAHAVDAPLTEENIGSCELLLLAVYPQAAADYLEAMGDKIAKTAVVVDCCGIKRQICEAGFRLAERHGWLYVGGHPMAGTHFSGFKYSRADLFKGAPMVLVPPVFDDIRLLERVKALLAPPQFGQFSVTTAEKHDRMIAFTSQLAHVVSNAYIKSPTAGAHRGFSAGSYKDLTRVAWLNAPMWTELFLDNRDFLLAELDTLMENLQVYRDALANGDAAALCTALEAGKRRKEEVDGI